MSLFFKECKLKMNKIFNDTNIWFHTGNMKEIILSQNNTIKDKKVYFQREAMIQEPVEIDEIDDFFNKNLLRLLRTASICSILSL